MSTRLQYYEESDYQEVAGALIEAGRIRIVDQLTNVKYSEDSVRPLLGLSGRIADL